MAELPQTTPRAPPGLRQRFGRNPSILKRKIPPKSPKSLFGRKDPEKKSAQPRWTGRRFLRPTRRGLWQRSLHLLPTLDRLHRRDAASDHAYFPTPDCPRCFLAALPGTHVPRETQRHLLYDCHGEGAQRERALRQEALDHALRQLERHTRARPSDIFRLLCLDHGDRRRRGWGHDQPTVSALARRMDQPDTYARDHMIFWTLGWLPSHVVPLVCAWANAPRRGAEPERDPWTETDVRRLLVRAMRNVSTVISNETWQSRERALSLARQNPMYNRRHHADGECTDQTCAQRPRTAHDRAPRVSNQRAGRPVDSLACLGCGATTKWRHPSHPIFMYRDDRDDQDDDPGYPSCDNGAPWATAMERATRMQRALDTTGAELDLPHRVALRSERAMLRRLARARGLPFLRATTRNTVPEDDDEAPQPPDHDRRRPRAVDTEEGDAARLATRRRVQGTENSDGGGGGPAGLATA